MDIFNTPRGHPKSKPFIDRIMVSDRPPPSPPPMLVDDGSGWHVIGPPPSPTARPFSTCSPAANQYAVKTNQSTKIK